MENKNKFNKAFLLIIAAIFFYGIILFSSDLNQILLIINQFKIELYLLILPLSIPTLLIQGWRYQLTLQQLNINLNFKDSFLIYLSGLSMTLTPGGTGSVIKSYFLKKITGNSFSSTTPIIIYEKWLELVAIITIIGLLLFWHNMIESQIIFIIGFTLSTFIFFLFKKSIGLNFVNNLFTKIKYFQKFSIDSDEFKQATKKLTKTKTIIKLLSITFLSKLIPMLAVFFVFQIFSSNFDIFSTSQVYFTSLIAGILSFVPGGLIITESSLLGLIIKIGSDFSTATILVLLIRFLTFWLPTILGFISIRIISKRI